MVTSTATSSSARETLERVMDPEIPVVSIEDLGILRDVVAQPDGSVDVVITPTYSGCPAMKEIEEDIRSALQADGFGPVTVRTVLSPAWTTDWMSESGRQKLADYGIAPPAARAPSGPVHVSLSRRPPAPEVHCPRCGGQARETSRFGSTACKSAWICNECLEPFDHFKAI